ncbi:hypothetical protein L228DRAFT_247590 [Xylona heveae TC161]|uniref:Uncharacterized protein n=1 Tax=Xylona heveae (strain CBS 132557 / TC161) TaxID=1328760 RepID=A0A165GB93_XYLHT|nr:hypothetical protein L228DRAFT_247590 [Xylona heveae TC161]KZF21979.1 hypothetical protein L228DRAFT_247590 [Xylona heveae TC161]
MTDQSAVSIPIRSADNGERSHSSLSMDEKMGEAIQTYRDKMYKSNVQFIHDRVEDIEAMNLPNEEAKLALMGRFWFHMDKWYIPERVSLNAHLEGARKRMAQVEREKAVKRLEDVKNLHHPFMDGFWPPTLNSTQCQAFSEALEIVANEMAGIRRNEAEWIHVSEDLKSFLRFARRLEDPNFRFAPICGFEMYDDPGELLQGKPFEETRDFFIRSLRYKPEEHLLDWMGGYIELKATFYCGEAVRKGFTYYSFYAYCRPYTGRKKGGDKDHGNHEWAWRVLFFSDSDGVDDPGVVVFHTLLDFIEWYGSWFERMDVAEMQIQMFEDPEDLFSQY